MVNRFRCEVETMGGKIKQRMISPKGLYSRPKECDSVSLFQNPSKQYVIPLQNDKKLLIELKDNDVIVQDDKSYIYFDYEGESINIESNNNINVRGGNEVTMKAKVLNLEAELINIKSSTSVKFEAVNILHGTQKIGNKHIHIKPKTPPT